MFTSTIGPVISTFEAPLKKYVCFSSETFCLIFIFRINRLKIEKLYIHNKISVRNFCKTKTTCVKF